MIGKVQVQENEWYPLDNEAFREYVFADGVYRINNPLKVMIKRKPEGDSHRVISKGSDNQPISHYVRAGWMAIKWEGLDGTEAFGW